MLAVAVRLVKFVSDSANATIKIREMPDHCVSSDVITKCKIKKSS